MNELTRRIREVLRSMRIAQIELCIRSNERAVLHHQLALYAALQARDEALANHAIETHEEPPFVPTFLLKPAENIRPMRKASK